MLSAELATIATPRGVAGGAENAAEVMPSRRKHIAAIDCQVAGMGGSFCGELERCQTQGGRRHYPLHRYSGGGLGWGLLLTAHFARSPLPNPPPEYQWRGQSGH